MPLRGFVEKGMGIAVNKLADYGRENGVTVSEPYTFVAQEREGEAARNGRLRDLT